MRVIVLGLALALTACASNKPAPVERREAPTGGVYSARTDVPPETDEENRSGPISSTRGTVSSAGGAASETVRSEAADAATAPLEDFNLKREEIPEPLKAVTYVYAAEPEPDCPAIAAEIATLDPVLGRDYDADEAEGKSVSERGGELAGDAVIDGIRGAATGWIPYRGLVREVTGAARWDRKVARAYAAGAARRAYLKGLGAAKGCPPPAAPLKTVKPEKEPKIVTPETREGDGNRWGAPVPPEDLRGSSG